MAGGGEGVTGWDLYATLQDQAANAGYYASQPPTACPVDGTPLVGAPPGAECQLYCPFDFWQYPRDYDASTMSGM
jgi:hypothetical protein